MDFIALHTLDGRDVHVNPALVVSISEARPDNDPNKRLTGEVRCVVSMVDGKFVSVIETCDSVRARIREGGR